MMNKRTLFLTTLTVMFTMLIGTATAQMDTATYSVTFDATWSEGTHPHPTGAFPAGAHFSGPVGAVHNDGVSFWDVGGVASAGMERMAETGGKAILTGEVNVAIADGTAKSVISQGGLDSPADTSFTIDVDTANPLVTIVTMIAPSPDWFVGVSGLSLRSGSAWVPSLTVDLFPYDSGTDDGEAYTSSNTDTDPQGTIESLTGVSPFSAEPIGTFTFELVADPTAVTMQSDVADTSNVMAVLFALLFVGVITTAVAKPF